MKRAEREKKGDIEVYDASGIYIYIIYYYIFILNSKYSQSIIRRRK